VAAPLSLRFDGARGAIGLDVTVHGAPLHMILDTGVDPSAIDAARAAALGLKVDHADGGEASGEGDAKHAAVYPVILEGLSVGGRSAGKIEALAMDMSGLSARYGRRLDGVLGYSFLKTRIVLIDYAAQRLDILDHAGHGAPRVRSCKTRWSTPLRGFGEDTIPRIDGFRLGAASGPISLDTGSNGGITLYPAALDLPAVKAALVEQGEASVTGARGDTKVTTFVLNAPVGFGPFTVPPGQVVTLRAARGEDDRVANVGNKLFAGLKLKVLLDYPARKMTFYGDCAGS
jgi:hypothetical protein